MMRGRWHITISILFLIGISSGFCGQGSVSLESKVDRAKITIGDRITYSIKVTKDENVVIEMPEVGANLGMFEILDYNDPEPQKADGKITQTREYIISTFDVGEYEIPPVTIRFTTEGDTVWQELSTEKIKIEVESLKPSEEGDIRDIKPPLELKLNLKPIIRMIVAGLIIILIGILIFYLIKRRKEGKSLIPGREKPLRPPHEIALEELGKLVNSNLLSERKVKQFYIRISEIIRRYIEGRFYIVAIEMTTMQLIENMKQAEIEHDTTELVNDFLDSCDLVKFAKYIPTDQENQKAIEQAYEIINRTKIEFKEEMTEEDKPEPSAERKSTGEQIELVDQQAGATVRESQTDYVAKEVE